MRPVGTAQADGSSNHLRRARIRVAEAMTPRVAADSGALADAIQGWLAELPSWEPEGLEAWVPFLHRYRDAESFLAGRIRRLPACKLNVTSNGRWVHLRLGGVAVRSRAGLAGTCRVWIAEARANAVS